MYEYKCNVRISAHAHMQQALTYNVFTYLFMYAYAFFLKCCIKPYKNSDSYLTGNITVTAENFVRAQNKVSLNILRALCKN